MCRTITVVDLEYELSAIIAHLRLLADIASPYDGSLNINSQNLSYVMQDLSTRLEKNIQPHIYKIS